MRIKTVLLSMCIGAAMAMPILSWAEEEASAPGKITFVGKNLVATANGTFHKWAFTKVDFDAQAPGESVVALEVDLASIDTGIVKRDDHLRDPDFFDVENHPTAKLKFHSFAKAAAGESGNAAYTATLDWEMHGAKKAYEQVRFEVTNAEPVTIKGELTINRMDFSIGEPHSKLNPMSIKEEIPITFEATLPEATE